MNLSDLKQNIKYILNVFKIGILINLQYRADLIIRIAAETFRALYYVVLIEIIFFNFESFLGYNKFEMILLWAIGYINFTILVTFINNIESLAFEIVEGTLDNILLKPINTIFYILFREFRIFDVTNILVGIFALIFLNGKVSINFSDIDLFYFIVSEISLIIFTVSINLFVMTLSFWLGNMRAFQQVFETLFSLSKFPIESFSGWMKSAFVYSLPFVLFGSIPGMILLRDGDENLILLMFCISIIWLLIARITWNIGVGSYSSANLSGNTM